MPGFGRNRGPPFGFAGRGPWRGPFQQPAFGAKKQEEAQSQSQPQPQPQPQPQSGDEVKSKAPPNMSPEEIRLSNPANAAANMVSSIFTNVASIAQDAILNANVVKTSRPTASAPVAAPSSTIPRAYEAPQAELVDDVTFAPGARVPANSSFVKKWTIKNSGVTPWPLDSRLEVCGRDNVFSSTFK